VLVPQAEWHLGVRRAVFVEEQGVPLEEIDEYDAPLAALLDAAALGVPTPDPHPGGGPDAEAKPPVGVHLLALMDGKPAGAGEGPALYKCAGSSQRRSPRRRMSARHLTSFCTAPRREAWVEGQC